MGEEQTKDLIKEIRQRKRTMKRRIRNLTTKEIAEICQTWDNFNLVFGRRNYIVRDITNRVYEVTIFNDFDFDTKNCIAHQTFKTLKKLEQGLDELCEKYC